MIVAITNDSILVQGSKVSTIEAAYKTTDAFIPELVEELKFQSSKSILNVQDRNTPRSITIMGDENTPYQLLKKILASCRQSNYTNVAFAVRQKVKRKV